MKRAKNSKGLNRILLVAAVLLSAFFGVARGADAAVPKKGTVAVVVDGWDDQHNASAESILVQVLLSNGYKIVDQKKLAEIRRSEAGRLALEGNVDAIMKLSSKYGVSTVITARIQAGMPMQNEFGLFTGTASMAVKATASNGTLLYADTVSGKQVGYTPDEAAQKSIEAAAKVAVGKMTQ
jgi:hypothetical protein